MKRILIMIVIAMLPAVAAPGWPQRLGRQAPSDGKQAYVQFIADTRVGQVILNPGYYRFQHEVIDSSHYLVVRDEMTRQAGGRRSSRDGILVRVSCQVVPTRAEHRQTTYYTIDAPDGVEGLIRLDVVGERTSHIVGDPQR